MGYFRELPNLLYPSFLPEKTSSLDFIEVKNIFRRVKLRDDLFNNFTIFEKYQIPEGSRPDTVAEEIFGSANFDWVILTVAGIINVRNEWPLSNRDLYNYANNKYGESLNSTRFFETKEVKNAETKKSSTFKKKKKIKKNISSGIAYVYSTFNNTIISIADESGNVVS